jgi:DNA-directed RNA polymerase specialized sigma24 family protein
VFSPAVTALIMKRLARARVPAADHEDIVQDVREALLHHAHPPADDDELAKLTQAITGNKLASRYRKLAKEQKAIAVFSAFDALFTSGARDKATGVHAQQVAAVREAAADGTVAETDLRILHMKTEGFSDEEIASALGVGVQTVANRATKARKRIRQKWQARAAALGALLGIALLFFMISRRRADEARLRHPPPAPAPSAAPAPPPEIPVAVQAAGLRDEAASACARQDYLRCKGLLDSAAKLDPAGEAQDSVRKLRHVIEDRPRQERVPDAKSPRLQ